MTGSHDPDAQMFTRVTVMDHNLAEHLRYEKQDEIKYIPLLFFLKTAHVYLILTSTWYIILKLCDLLWAEVVLVDVSSLTGSVSLTFKN